MKKILVMVDARPEAIKMVPVVHALKKNPEKFDVHFCSSGQHGLMLSQPLDAFGLSPDSSLEVMTANQNLAGLSSRLFAAIDDTLDIINPDVVLVQGRHHHCSGYGTMRFLSGNSLWPCGGRLAHWQYACAISRRTQSQNCSAMCHLALRANRNGPAKPAG